ncbi:metalloregulator ArsR/SmtB family transcription factor [uncultured Hyphomonas sp.]|uniref:ArsR/SmtB family transcription factor n=1 Tax=uncultured Hyphomonas sp. TaxID=225298 RepID=UPI0030D8B865|tara:strand:+ start:4468 stop:4863 length:396 start_codon:yes stop_codon:yes gene_type:complete
MTPISKDLAPLANEATELLKALAHPERLIICCQLRDTEMSVGDIETTLGIKQPRLSRELSKLRDTGLVTTRKESKLVFYTLSDTPRVRNMVDAICAVMLGKTATNSAGATASPKLKPNRPGGYGVFARTGT